MYLHCSEHKSDDRADDHQYNKNSAEYLIILLEEKKNEQ